jgi:enolase
MSSSVTEARARRELEKAEREEHKLRVKEEKEFARAEAKRHTALEKLRKKIRNSAARELIKAEKAAQRAETKFMEARAKFEAKLPFPRAKDGGESKQELRARATVEHAEINFVKAQQHITQKRNQILAIEREMADPDWEENALYELGL